MIYQLARRLESSAHVGHRFRSGVMLDPAKGDDDAE